MLGKKTEILYKQNVNYVTLLQFRFCQNWEKASKKKQNIFGKSLEETKTLQINRTLFKKYGKSL